MGCVGGGLIIRISKGVGMVKSPRFGLVRLRTRGRGTPRTLFLSLLIFFSEGAKEFKDKYIERGVQIKDVFPFWDYPNGSLDII